MNNFELYNFFSLIFMHYNCTFLLKVRYFVDIKFYPSLMTSTQFLISFLHWVRKKTVTNLTLDLGFKIQQFCLFQIDVFFS